MRWFAAALVFVSHARGQFDDRDVVRHMWVGRAGVSFFFILSGFVLAWSHRKGDRPAGFYRRRFARIYPAYAASLLI
ncbi:acyltransferase family protein, partial [Klebsiella pneumoniae]